MKWDRGEHTIGPSIRPVYTYVLVLISLLATLGIQGFRYKRVWTPLERHYFLDYLSSQIVGAVRDNGWYTLLEVVTRKKSRLALDSDVMPAVTASGENTFAPTKETLKHGSHLESYRARYNNAELHTYLGNMIYHSQTPMDLVRAALFTICGWPTQTLQVKSAGNRGIRSMRALGPPVDTAIATTSTRVAAQENSLALLSEQGTALYYTDQNIAELWNAMTRPVDRDGLGSIVTEAEREVEAIEAGVSLLADGEAVYREWRRIVIQYDFLGVQVHDARLAATMYVPDRPHSHAECF